MTSATNVAERAGLTGEGLFGGATRWFPLLVCVYFLLQALIRIAISPELGMDDAELVLLARSWDWGYGSQPPLYTWMLAAVFAVTGESVAAVIVLKNALLAVTYLCLHRTALRVLGDPLTALAATVSLLFIPQIAWESQRALSHTVLAVAAASAALLVFVRLVEERRPADYVLFGVLVAAGLLSKLNVAYFVAALGLAALATSYARPAILNVRILPALAVAAALLAPTGLWMLANPDAVTRRVSKFGLGEGDGVLGSLLLGLGDFAMATIAFLALLVVVVVGATIRAAPAAPPGPRPSLDLLARGLLLGLLIVLLTVVTTGATTVKDRWLQPVLFYAPVVIVGLMAGRLPPSRLALIVRLAGVAALAVMIALPVRVWLAGGGDKVPVENRPYTVFAEQIRAEIGFTTGTIIAGDYATGGNLAINLPDASALIPEYGRLAVPTPWPVLLVWSGDDAVPAPVAETLRFRFGVDPPAVAPVVLSAPIHHGGGSMDTLRVLRIDEPG